MTDRALSAIWRATVAAIAAIRRHVTLFRVLYWTVAVATFRHSAIGFATLEGGDVALGALSAAAVDVGMMLAAERLPTVRNWRAIAAICLALGLVLAAAASIYSQLLYAVTHADAVVIAAGALWMGEWAMWIANARVVVFPFLLPTLAVVYAFASRTESAATPGDVRETPSEIAETAQPEKATIYIWRAIYPQLNGDRHEMTADDVARHIRARGLALPSPRTLDNWAQEARESGGE